jgi:heptosyltransferase-2
MSGFLCDCKEWEGYRPCRRQKGGQAGSCNDCRDYSPIRRNVLIIEAGGLGSVLRTSVVAKEMRKKYPDSKIQWLTSDRNLELLASIPSVDRSYASTWESLIILGAQAYDVVINFESNPLYLAFASNLRARERFGFIMNDVGNLKEASGFSKTLLRLQTHDAFRRRENQRSMQQMLLESVGLEWAGQNYDLVTTDADDKWAKTLLEDKDIAKGDVVVALNVGSSIRHKAKRWPPSRFYELAALCEEKHPDWKLLVVAGPEDIDAYGEIMGLHREEPLGNIAFLGCQNTISQFISLIRRISVMVSADTFGLHVALALDKPAVSLWGPQPKNETYSYGKELKVSLDLDCAPCFAGSPDQCASDRHLLCMDGIDAKSVLVVLEEAVYRSDY